MVFGSLHLIITLNPNQDVPIVAGMWRGYFGFGSEGRYHVIFHQKDSALFVGLFFCPGSFHDDHHLNFRLSYRIMTKGRAKKGMVFRGLKSAVA